MSFLNEFKMIFPDANLENFVANFVRLMSKAYGRNIPEGKWSVVFVRFSSLYYNKTGWFHKFEFITTLNHQEVQFWIL